MSGLWLFNNESHYIPTGGFIYDFYSHGIIGVIVYGHVIITDYNIYLRAILGFITAWGQGNIAWGP